jgi:hypothetical protein
VVRAGQLVRALHRVALPVRPVDVVAEHAQPERVLQAILNDDASA